MMAAGNGQRMVEWWGDTVRSFGLPSMASAAVSHAVLQQQQAGEAGI
jgi:hypothetical protein